MTVSPRDRVMAAIARQPLDRLPTDYWGTSEMNHHLMEALGARSMPDVWRQLNIDKIVQVGPAYTGPACEPGCNYWGMAYEAVPHAGGHYHEQVVYPLADAETIDDLEQYRWPSPDWFDYSVLRDACLGVPEYAIDVGYYAIFFFHLQLRGLENALVDPLLNPEFTQHLLMRLDAFMGEHCARCMEATDGLAQITQVTDDYGCQSGPIMSLDTFRGFYLPYIEAACARARAFGLKVFHHDDGSIRLFIPELLKAGIDVLNPVQWRCPGMELESLKADFGDSLCFHGGVDNQVVLPFGTPEEVTEEVRRDIEVLASDGTGYIVAPCHNFQGNTPIANVLALYEAAHKYGRLTE